MVLYNVILRRMEIRGHCEKADHIDRVMIYAYPLSFLVAISILYFVFLVTIQPFYIFLGLVMSCLKWYTLVGTFRSPHESSSRR